MQRVFHGFSIIPCARVAMRAAAAFAQIESAGCCHGHHLLRIAPALYWLSLKLRAWGE